MMCFQCGDVGRRRPNGNTTPRATRGGGAVTVVVGVFDFNYNDKMEMEMEIRDWIMWHII